MKTQSFTIIAAFALSVTVGGVHAARADEMRIGDNNRITEVGTVNGAQTATAIGLNANAQNGVASIMAGGGLTIGNSNSITQIGTLNGAQTATAIGLGANAQNGIASIMSGAH